MLTEWLLNISPVAVTVYDRQLRFIRQNAAMARLLGLSEHDRQGKRLVDVLDGPDATAWEQQMRQVLLTGEPALSAEIHGRTAAHPEQDRVFAVSASALKDHDGQVRGVCTVAADITEEYEARQRLALLNEASTQIGSTLDVIRTAQELADLAVPLIGDWVNIDLLDTLLKGEEPGPFAEGVALRRVANQSVVPGAPEALRQVGEVDFYPAHSPPVRCMATSRTILHRVTDPAVQDWLAKDPLRADSFRENGFKSIMGIPVCARGTLLGVAIFLRRSARLITDGDRLLAEDLVARAAVCLDNARRFSRERTAALGLQQSLLPRGIPQHPAVEAAYRYLPAGGRSGVGGDWFDVIPLSGARVALVVGDVVGHGLEAAATMGRLRTAVRTLADIDLPPDELLTHLDDLVFRIADEDGGPGTDTADLGATCAYAVYDPVSRTCTFVRAGHTPPFVVDAGGTAKQVNVPVGPPLGLGSLPFESAEVPLDDGSLIALYTDGLLDAHKRDLDEGLARLRTALARPCPSLEDLCDTVIDDMLPAGHSDDIALVIARTRPLDTEHVAAMEVPADPAAVADTRSWAADQLAAWGLDDHSFVTELAVSELVTNAIRYGQPPIQLRLLNVGSLICEVSDASSTAPHMRRARLSDEGGRGLLLVAQLTHRWGTRHSRQGKTIWCEQPILGG